MNILIIFTFLIILVIVLKKRRKSVTVEKYIDKRLKQGADPQELKKELLRDLNEGGRIFGTFRNAIRATTSGSLKRASDSGAFSEPIEEIATYRWVAVADKNVCKDCQDRDGKAKTWDQWEKIGLPEDDKLTCEKECRCVLVPDKVIKLNPDTLEEIN